MCYLTYYKPVSSGTLKFRGKQPTCYIIRTNLHSTNYLTYKYFRWRLSKSSLRRLESDLTCFLFLLSKVLICLHSEKKILRCHRIFRFSSCGNFFYNIEIFIYLIYSLGLELSVDHKNKNLKFDSDLASCKYFKSLCRLESDVTCLFFLISNYTV